MGLSFVSICGTERAGQGLHSYLGSQDGCPSYFRLPPDLYDSVGKDVKWLFSKP